MIPIIVALDTSTPTTCISTETATFDLNTANIFSVTSAITNATPSSAVSSSYDETANTITFASHDLVTGLKVQLTSSGSLPTGLSLLTDYFVIRMSATQIKLATSYANAVAGTAVDFDGDGTGDITVTPTSLAGCTFTVEWSNNGTDFVSSSTTNITTSTVVGVQLTVIPYRYLRLTWTVTAGYLTISNCYLMKQ